MSYKSVIIEDWEKGADAQGNAIPKYSLVTFAKGYGPTTNVILSPSPTPDKVLWFQGNATTILDARTSTFIGEWFFTTGRTDTLQADMIDTRYFRVPVYPNPDPSYIGTHTLYLNIRTTELPTNTERRWFYTLPFPTLGQWTEIIVDLQNPTSASDPAMPYPIFSLTNVLYHWNLWFSFTPIRDPTVPGYTEFSAYIGDIIVEAFYTPPVTVNLTMATTIGGTTDTNYPPGVYSITQDSPITVTAIPYSGYLFDHWEVDGIPVGTTNPYTITMDTNHTLTAVFATIPIGQHNLTVDSNPQGISFTLEKIA